LAAGGAAVKIHLGAAVKIHLGAAVKVPVVASLMAACLAAAFACTGARAQTAADEDALRSGLTEMLSLLSMGAISVAGQPAQMTQSGNDFRIRLPLNGFVAPPDASVEAVAHPSANGAWDVVSMTLPPAGALGSSIDQVVSYTIARQVMHGRVDPNLLTASTFAADLSAITVQTASGDRASEQGIERFTVDGTLSAMSGGRVDVSARDSAANLNIMVRDPGGLRSNTFIRHVDGNLSLAGLDRAQGRRFAAAARSLRGTTGSPPDSVLPAAQDALRAMLDATDGLLTRIEAEETLDGLTFSFFGGGNGGALGRIHLRVAANAPDLLVNAGIDIGLDEVSFTALSPDKAAFLPHHVTARSILAGLPSASVKALLRAAIAGADPEVLQRQFAALLAVPGARAAVESLVFDAGPLHVLSSARLTPRGNGEISAEVHISASGVDALLAEVQAGPDVSGVLPMLFLVKGMGRVQGDSVTWDIVFGGGPMTVNGVPFGQPAARTR
jgi:hypothetical protein